MSEMTDEQLAKVLAEKLFRWTYDDGWWDGSVYLCTQFQWSPCENIAQAFQVQAEIERRSLTVDFMCALDGLVEAGRSDWPYVNATARQRCLAAVNALAAVGGGE